MMRATLLAFLLFMGAAAAQEGKPQEKKEDKAQERSRLNLRLDNPSSFATVKPEEKAPRKELPALGGDAQRLPESGMSTSNPTFPKDTAPGH